MRITLATAGSMSFQGDVIGGARKGGVTALPWAGLVRITLLRHVTWSVNSPSAAVIRLLERPGSVYDVRRSTPVSVAACCA